MSEPVRRRPLRPGTLVPTGGQVWVVDEVQPVAVVLDALTADQLALVGWPQVPAGASPERRIVLAGDAGLWVQQHGGPLVLVRADGGLDGRYVSDAILGAVSAHGAWCAPEPRAQDIAATPDAPPSDQRTSALLRLATPGQATRTVRVDAPVQSLRASCGDLFVEVETGRWARRPLGTSTSWDLEPETSWLRLRGDQDVPDRLTTAGHRCTTAVPARPPWWSSFRLPQPDDLVGSDQPRARPHARTPGLDWFVGASGDRPSYPQPLFAVAFEAGTARERLRLVIGSGAIADVAAIQTHVWVAVAQPPTGSYRPSSPTTVVRVDAATGQVQTVIGPGSVEISSLAWALGPRPVDAEDYEQVWRRHLSGLDAYWTDTGGHVHPLSEGLSDTVVDVVGTWPDTALHVTFRWARRPGTRLRRVIGLYDDLGRAREPVYADIHLMEDLDTGHVPDTPTSGSGYLDV